MTPTLCVFLTNENYSYLRIVQCIKQMANLIRYHLTTVLSESGLQCGPTCKPPLSCPASSAGQPAITASLSATSSSTCKHPESAETLISREPYQLLYLQPLLCIPPDVQIMSGRFKPREPSLLPSLLTAPSQHKAIGGSAVTPGSRESGREGGLPG